MKIGQEIYSKTGQNPGQGSPGESNEPNQNADAVDAEYNVHDDENQAKK